MPQAHAGTIVRTEFGGRTLSFLVTNPDDEIQRYHAAGEFYEAEELQIIGRYVTRDTRFLDVGSNVGNHILYLSLLHGIEQIVAIEPNRDACWSLRINLRLNNLSTSVDLSRLGYGLSDETSRATAHTPTNNLGGTRLVASESGPGSLVRGDELFRNVRFDFIKIDVEGMEMQCLSGLDELIRRCRPTMFVEVDRSNTDSFRKWCIRSRYAVVEGHKRYQCNENVLIRPCNR